MPSIPVDCQRLHNRPEGTVSVRGAEAWISKDPPKHTPDDCIHRNDTFAKGKYPNGIRYVIAYTFETTERPSIMWHLAASADDLVCGLAQHTGAFHQAQR